MDLEICNVSLAHFTESSTSSVGSELQEDFLSSSFMGGQISMSSHLRFQA